MLLSTTCTWYKMFFLPKTHASSNACSHVVSWYYTMMNISKEAQTNPLMREYELSHTKVALPA